MKLTPTKIEECKEWISHNGLQEYGGAPVERYCQALGFNKATHYRWIAANETYAAAIKDGQEAFKQNLADSAFKGLCKLVEGYEYTETRTEYVTSKDGKPVIKNQVTTKKRAHPNTAAVIFALTNLDPERWKQRQLSEITGKDGAPIELESKELSIKEAQELLNRIDKEI